MFFRFRKLPRKCRLAGKISYPSEVDAKMSIANQAQYILRERVPVRAYPCGTHWHTTSKPLREIG